MPQETTQSNENYCYYTLSFTLKFKYDNDIVYVAMNYPYPYTKCIQHIDQVISQNADQLL